MRTCGAMVTKSEDLINALAGGYSLKVSDGNGCVTSINATITEPSKLNLVLDKLNNVACSGQETGELSMRASGGVQPYNYLWNTGATTSSLTNVAAGTYSVSVTDAAGCKASYNGTITQPRKTL